MDTGGPNLEPETPILPAYTYIYIYLVQILVIRIENVETFAILDIIIKKYNIKYKQIIYR